MIRITIASPIHASQQSIAVQSAIQHQATTTTTSLTTLSSGAMMSPQISSPTATSLVAMQQQHQQQITAPVIITQTSTGVVSLPSLVPSPMVSTKIIIK